MLAILSILVVAVILPHYTGDCRTVGDMTAAKRFNFMDSGPCMKLCRAECGGICFFNTQSFTHECNCAFKRSLG